MYVPFSFEKPANLNDPRQKLGTQNSRQRQSKQGHFLTTPGIYEAAFDHAQFSAVGAFISVFMELHHGALQTRH